MCTGPTLWAKWSTMPFSVWTRVKARAERAQRRKLETTAVVVVTCSSAGQLLLNGLRFDVLVLYECCQMVC